MTVLTITEYEDADHGVSVERLKLTLDTAPSPEAITQIITLLSTPAPKPRKRRSDAGVPKKQDMTENLAIEA